MKSREIVQKILWDTTKRETYLFQHKILGFSFVFFTRRDIKNIFSNLYQERNSTISGISSLFLIPHVYIFPLVFGWMALNAGLSHIYGVEFSPGNRVPYIKWVILDICLYICMLAIILKLYKKVFRSLSLKIQEIYNNSYSFDISRRRFQQLNNIVFPDKNTLPFKLHHVITRNGIKNISVGKIWIFLFAQPFIFGHGYIFAGFSFTALFIFDIFIALILSKKIKNVLFLVAYIYFILLSFIYDYLPYFCNEKIKNRYFFLQLRKYFHELNKNLELLEKNIRNIKLWIIEDETWVWLSEWIKNLYHIQKLVASNKIIKDTSKLESLIEQTIKESIEEYCTIFDALKERYTKDNSIYQSTPKKVQQSLEKFEKIEKKLRSRINYQVQ